MRKQKEPWSVTCWRQISWQGTGRSEKVWLYSEVAYRKGKDRTTSKAECRQGSVLAACRQE